MWYWSFFFSSRRRHTRCALVTGVQTCALPIYEADAILPRFAQPDDTARADVDPGAADFVERIEAVLKCPRRDDILVILRARVDIMVVIIEPGDRERLRLFLGQHPQRHAGFHAHLAHALHHLDDRGHVAVLGVAPGGAHADALRARIDRKSTRLNSSH